MLLKAARLVAELQQRASFDTGVLLRELIAGAAESVPGAQYAGITVTKRHRPSETAAATHPIQWCWTTFRIAVNRDLASRPPRNKTRSASTISGPMSACRSTVRGAQTDADSIDPVVRDVREGQTTAALNFYAEPTNAFDDGSVNLGMIFASHTAPVWNMARHEQQFRTALVSRDIIGQAKGMLMQRFDIDAAAAFGMLKRVSQEPTPCCINRTAGYYRRSSAGMTQLRQAWICLSCVD